ncbi:MAG: acetolactate synthase small subunit [Spirochaetaceae bacterium]|jgi:acetolactate synthase-1/3 small subunit|nr:acetolactate synthase small subunit [Spirochaetaceae bacterium]
MESMENKKNRRYILSVLVDNHAGVLSRVSGLFSRRGFNIDSLTVGETHHRGRSRMTIVVCGDEYVLEQITKQLSKLVEVISITHCNPPDTVMREMVLVKVAADYATRGGVIETANIFRARIVDVAPESIVIEATGSEDKVASLIKLLEPYGILELMRTGITAMLRGSVQDADFSKKFDFSSV